MKSEYCVHLGYPLCSDGGHSFDLDLPVECDDEYWVQSGNSLHFEQPIGKEPTVAYFNCFLRLNQIQAFAMRTVVSVFITFLLSFISPHISIPLRSQRRFLVSLGPNGKSVSSQILTLPSITGWTLYLLTVSFPHGMLPILAELGFLRSPLGSSGEEPHVPLAICCPLRRLLHPANHHSQAFHLVHENSTLNPSLVGGGLSSSELDHMRKRSQVVCSRT